MFLESSQHSTLLSSKHRTIIFEPILLALSSVALFLYLPLSPATKTHSFPLGLTTFPLNTQKLSFYHFSSFRSPSQCLSSSSQLFSIRHPFALISTNPGFRTFAHEVVSLQTFLLYACRFPLEFWLLPSGA